MDLLLLLTAACLVLGSTADAQSCSVANIPTFGDRGGPQSSRLPNQLQVIAPEYTFTCHGRVTQWGACVQPGGNLQRYDINFQVLRPSPVSADVTRYSVVGSNRITNGQPEASPLNLGRCIAFNVPVMEQILVEPGDVVGFYSEHVNRDMDGGVQVEEDRTDVTLFTAAGVSNLPTVFSVGFNQFIADSTTAAPVITAAVEFEMLSTSQVVPASPAPTVMLLPSSAVIAPGTPPPTSPENIIDGTSLQSPILTGVPGTSPTANQPPTPQNTGSSDPPPSGGGDGGSSSTVAIIAGIATGSSVLILLIIIVVILICIRQCRQNSLPKTRRANIVTERNEAYMTNTAVERSVVITKRNEAYVTNTDIIPAARNKAYGVVGLEDMNSSNKEDTTDCTYETIHLSEEPPCEEYAYVR